MAFTRDELKSQEEQPQTEIPDETNPFTPADASATDGEVAPSDPADETPPDESGDGTSDENVETEESSTSDPVDPDDDSVTPEEVPPPKKGSAQERIHELVEQRDGYKAYGTYAEEQIRIRDEKLAELNKRLQGVTPSSPGAPVAEVDDPIPSLEDPDVQYDPDKLQRKLVAWRETVKEKARRAAAAPPVDPEAEGRKIVDTFNSRVTEFKKDHADFEETVSNLPRLAPGAAKLVVKDPTGPAILLWLGNHRKDAVRIVGLSEEEQIAEIGEIRATIRNTTQGKPKVIPPADKAPPQAAAKTPAKPKSQSNAPPPPTAVRGGSRHDQVPITDPSLSMEEFVRRERAARTAKFEDRRKFRAAR